MSIQFQINGHSVQKTIEEDAKENLNSNFPHHVALM